MHGYLIQISYRLPRTIIIVFKEKLHETIRHENNFESGVHVIHKCVFLGMSKSGHCCILERTDDTSYSVNQIPHLEKGAASIHDQGIKPLRLLVFDSDHIKLIIYHLIFNWCCHFMYLGGFRWAPISLSNGSLFQLWLPILFLLSEIFLMLVLWR